MQTALSSTPDHSQNQRQVIGWIGILLKDCHTVGAGKITFVSLQESHGPLGMQPGGLFRLTSGMVESACKNHVQSFPIDPQQGLMVNTKSNRKTFSDSIPSRAT